MSLRDRAPSLALAALAALLAGLLATTFDEPPAAQAAAGSLPGLLLDDGRAPQRAANRTIDRVDQTARTRGPWSLIVRRPTGSLGRGSAVVTWPVAELSPGRSARVRDAEATVGPGIVTWRTGRTGIARIRGDLTEEELLRAAAGVTIGADSRPHASLPAGLRVVWQGPYRPPLQREARYGAAEVSEAKTLGDGLVFTSVQTGAAFEDGLLARAPSRPGVRVAGRRAVVAPTPGNGVLAWELAPGTVALVGWSGVPFGDAPVAALQRLAGKARVTGPSTWRSLRPQRLDAALTTTTSAPGR